MPLIIFGITCAFTSPVLSSLTPYVAPLNMLGTAYGLQSILYSAGQFFGVKAAGELLETPKDNGYFWTMIYLVIIIGVGTITNIIIYIDDNMHRGGVLTKVDKIDKNS